MRTQTIAIIWECDEYCQCSQAIIKEWNRGYTRAGRLQWTKNKVIKLGKYIIGDGMDITEYIKKRTLQRKWILNMAHLYQVDNLEEIKRHYKNKQEFQDLH